MKKILKTLALCLAGICLMTISSCNKNDDDEDTVTEQAFSNCFAFVEDIANGPSAYYDNIGFQIRLNYSKATAEVLVTNLRITSGTTYPTFKLVDMPFSIEKDGWINIQANNLTPEMGGYADIPLLTNIRMRLYQRIIDQTYTPGFVARFTINGQYAVTASFANQYVFGTTESTADNGDKFTTSATVYGLLFDTNTRCVNISLIGARFVSSMPAMNISFTNVPFTMRGGKAYFTTESLTPTYEGTPYPSFPITNLSGEFDFGEGLDMTFGCAPARLPNSYTVEVDAEFPVLEDVD